MNAYVDKLDILIAVQYICFILAEINSSIERPLIY